MNKAYTLIKNEAGTWISKGGNSIGGVEDIERILNEQHERLAIAQVRLSATHMLFATANSLSLPQWRELRDRLKVWADEAKEVIP